MLYSHHFSDNWSPVEGQKKILLFCERVSKDDIEVHFTYEDERKFDFLMFFMFFVFSRFKNQPLFQLTSSEHYSSVTYKRAYPNKRIDCKCAWRNTSK